MPELTNANSGIFYNQVELDQFESPNLLEHAGMVKNTVSENN